MTHLPVDSSLPRETPVQEGFHVGFVLLHDFSMIAFANAVETLRMANYISRRTLYRWTVVQAEPSQPVASNGLTVSSNGSAEDLASCNLVLVCGGLNIRQATTDPVRRLLRQCAARGAAMGALCTGSFALASAGLLDNHRCAIHWENLAAISEEFPKVRFTPEVFIFDRDRITCSGGTAPLHMVLHLIRGHHGPKLVMAVSEQFIVERLRASSDRQRIPQPECIGPGYQHLTEAAEIMAANIEEPLSLIELAGLVGLSLRQLERLFNRYFSMNPAQYYMNLRLRRAQELLTHSSQPIMQVTVACGFQSSSHFCKAYRSLFGHAPSDERRQQADKASAGRTSATKSPPKLVRVA
ncbi:GlxA family transcriptional regulator [Hydrogenophaga taeniospiralis]|jgi:AraC family transcriptional regulator, glycine betaine-responsive activator|uniref:GlxA family transcriptional regulator n=1 Tax=Hydrogenophaga taeniospiralis TaxID=65656 RepID=UPI001CFB1009|nr:GlxA family transcriptional regulator [Hydrogenophaga taeniospiralis]MCB4366987.1 GlxA family transcriptional regulator [Hydrogenophaga taeniospiralis]